MSNVTGPGGPKDPSKDFRIEDPSLEPPGTPKKKILKPGQQANLEISETDGKRLDDRSGVSGDSVKSKVADSISISDDATTVKIDFNQLAEVFFMMALQARRGAREGRLAQQESTQKSLKAEEKHIRDKAWLTLATGLAAAGLQTAGGAYGTFKGAQNLSQISQAATASTATADAVGDAATDVAQQASASTSKATDAVTETASKIQSETSSIFSKLDAQSGLTRAKTEILGGVGQGVSASGSAAATTEEAEQAEERAAAEKGRSAADTEKEFLDAMNKVVSDMLSMIQQVAQDKLATQRKIIENI